MCVRVYMYGFVCEGPNIVTNLYIEEPVRIIDCMDRTLRNRTIPYVRVLWRDRKWTDATWEPKYVMQQKYPELFSGMRNFEDEIS